MNRDDLGTLIMQVQDSLYHVAKVLLKNDTDCADAISETIVKAFSNIHTLRNDQYGKTWLIRILINECYAILRRRNKIVSIEEYPQLDIAEQKEDCSELYLAISKLPEDMRLCIVLYYLEGYSVKETAELLNVTESTVENRLMRARRNLKCKMEMEV